MTGPSLSPPPTITSLYHSLRPCLPSPNPDTNLAANLDHALRRAPDGIRDQLQELCHWLVCCKNLWPAAASGLPADTATPFSLHRQNQSLHADPDYVKRRIDALLGDSDAVLVQDIASYVTASDDSHWQALREQNHPAASIDPADYPRHWPRECIEWALRTMNMREAELWSANFEGMDLRFVSLRQADLYCASFDGANLENADVSLAEVEGATFQDTNLKGANLTRLTFSTDRRNLKGAIVDEFTILDYIGFDDDAYRVSINKEKPVLRNGLLLPRDLDHMIRDNFDILFESDDSEPIDGYMSPFTDEDAPHSRATISTRKTVAYPESETSDEESGPPYWQAALCAYLMILPAPFFLLQR
jgi:uncharacterized protein YjbI with pentapeptide repeats